MSLIGASCVGNFNFIVAFVGITFLPFGIVVMAFFQLCYDRRNMQHRLAHMSADTKRAAVKEALHLLFRIADSDNSGVIDPAELQAILKQLGWKNVHMALAAEVSQLVGATMNHSGLFVLSEDAFVTSMTSGSMSRILLARNAVHHHTQGRRMKPEDAAEQGKPGASGLLREDHSILGSTDSLVRWTLKRKLMANALSSATQFLLLAHTPVSRKVFQYFHCRNIDGVFYLRADYGLECGSERWLAFFPVILAVLLGFTVALPGVISLFLFMYRKKLYSTSVFQTLGWLYQPFVRGAEFWQVHDVLLKMVLTGMLIYIPAGARACVAVLVCLFVVANLNRF